MLSDDTGVVVAHFHPEGRVARHLLEFIAYVKQHVTPHIVLVSTGISDEDKLRVENYCPVIRRDNVGYDFWSYKEGLEALSPNRLWKRWLIINSSIVIANPSLLAHQLFSRPIEYGVIGLTSSEDGGEHVQSYCVMFDGEGFIRSDVMKNWWNAMQVISERDRVIREYEIGMSQYFKKLGVPVRAIYKPTQNEKLNAIIRVIFQDGFKQTIPATQDHVVFQLKLSNRLNPTHFMWDALFKQFGVVKIDFLKRSIFAPQLANILRSPEWASVPVRDLIVDALR